MGKIAIALITFPIPLELPNLVPVTFSFPRDGLLDALRGRSVFSGTRIDGNDRSAGHQPGVALLRIERERVTGLHENAR